MISDQIYYSIMLNKLEDNKYKITFLDEAGDIAEEDEETFTDTIDLVRSWIDLLEVTQ